MTALARLTAEIARIKTQTPVEAATEQLEQVQTRIAQALERRRECEAKGYSQSTWRMVNQSLHGLYALEREIKADLAGLAS